MATNISDFPVHLGRKVGLPPILTFLALMPAAIINYLKLPVTGAPGSSEYIDSLRIEVDNYILILANFIVIWLIGISPIFPVSLDLDERGITKKVFKNEYFYPWADLTGIVVSSKGGFRGRGGVIRFVRRGEIGPRKLVDLSPGMFRADREALAESLRKGIERWGSKADDINKDDAPFHRYIISKMKRSTWITV